MISWACEEKNTTGIPKIINISVEEDKIQWDVEELIGFGGVQPNMKKGLQVM